MKNIKVTKDITDDEIMKAAKVKAEAYFKEVKAHWKSKESKLKKKI